MSCSSGAWSRSTTLAPEAARASLSDVKSCNSSRASHEQDREADAEVEQLVEDDEEDDVQEAEHERGRPSVRTVRRPDRMSCVSSRPILLSRASYAIVARGLLSPD